MKVVILGALGMLGNGVARVLAREPGLDVIAVTRRPDAAVQLPFLPPGAVRWLADIHDLDGLRALLAECGADVVVNAIGVIKQVSGAEDPLLALPINAVLPHQLARLCGEAGARLVHVSTDCVFDGVRGHYSEDDVANATDLYGRSKLLGEVDQPHALTLRTSLVGHELGSYHSLIDWFLAQEGPVYGFTRAIFSGVTTVEFARVLARHVLPNAGLRGLYHLSAAPISKHDLLRLVARVYGKSIEIIPRSEPVIDRSLRSDRFRAATGYAPPDWPTLLQELHDVYAQREEDGIRPFSGIK
ncbi:dTDP-4-dehydrorhamnose reductase family protein [Ancylobacter polymorphus]|uniref:dTDP-4-dehydrorhamnose reductase n=1 Tax=Ancylobacter polymorphus TaxID=223390 RepID=A0ABU0BFM4_9HYPH|nr:SDR family oxidoreductase [Ancylobacter polymorphus]MDQ0304620.1 dTDP-4-dehydrorhamnose reductase [Ancylobacter polymorphus]